MGSISASPGIIEEPTQLPSSAPTHREMWECREKKFDQHYFCKIPNLNSNRFYEIFRTILRDNFMGEALASKIRL